MNKMKPALTVNQNIASDAAKAGFDVSNSIYDLIGYRTDKNAKPEYIVFINIDAEVDYELGETFAGTGIENLIWAKVVEAQSRHIPDIKMESQLTYRRILGEALVQAINGNKAGADALLIAAQHFIDEVGQQMSRTRTVAMGMVGLIVVFALVLYFDVILASGIDYRVALIDGAFGACVSVLIRGSDLKIDYKLALLPHLAQVASRWLIGATAGLVTYWLWNADIFTGEVVNNYRFLLICFSAGFFERTVNTVASKFKQDDRSA